MSDPIAHRHHRASTADEVAWQLSFDRTAVDRYLELAAIERGRLMQDIDVAEKRVANAAARIDERLARQRDELAALVARANDALAELERRWDLESAAIREEARRNVQEIVTGTQATVEEEPS